MKCSRAPSSLLVIELQREPGHVERTPSYLSLQTIGIFGGHLAAYSLSTFEEEYVGYLEIKISQSPAHGSLASSSLMRATEAEKDTPLRMHDLNFNPARTKIKTAFAAAWEFRCHEACGHLGLSFGHAMTAAKKRTLTKNMPICTFDDEA